MFMSHQVAELVAKCLQARDMAYCPYSQFPVGAAILTSGGAIITGTHVWVTDGNFQFRTAVITFYTLNKMNVNRGKLKRAVLQTSRTGTVYVYFIGQTHNNG